MHQFDPLQLETRYQIFFKPVQKNQGPEEFPAYVPNRSRSQTVPPLFPVTSQNFNIPHGTSREVFGIIPKERNCIPKHYPGWDVLGIGPELFPLVPKWSHATSQTHPTFNVTGDVIGTKS